MIRHMFRRFSKFKSIYSESRFETICQLMENEYDVPCLLCIISQTFCNAIIYNDLFVLNCIEKYMNEHAIMQFPGIVDWQGYIVQLAMPYEKWKIDGGIFVYDWIQHILNINVCIWFVDTLATVAKFHGFEKDAMIFHVMQFGTSVGHLCYEPLKEIV